MPDNSMILQLSTFLYHASRYIQRLSGVCCDPDSRVYFSNRMKIFYTNKPYTTYDKCNLFRSLTFTFITNL